MDLYSAPAIDSTPVLRYLYLSEVSTTVKAMEAADRGKGKRFKSAGALFEDSGI